MGQWGWFPFQRSNRSQLGTKIAYDPLFAIRAMARDGTGESEGEPLEMIGDAASQQNQIAAPQFLREKLPSFP